MVIALLQLQQRCVEALRRSRRGVSGSLDGVLWLPQPSAFARIKCLKHGGAGAINAAGSSQSHL